MARIIKWGHGSGVLLPAHVLKLLGWGQGTGVTIELGSRGTAIITTADEMVRDPTTKKAKPYVTTLKRFENSWIKTYNDLVAHRDKLPSTHVDLPMIRRIILWMEQDTYEALNSFIDELEGLEK